MKLNIGSLRLLSGLRKISVLIVIIFLLWLALLKTSGKDTNHVESHQVSRTNIIHIALTGQLTERHPNILDRLSNITKSIYKHCRGGQLLFHVFTDINSTIPRNYTDLILKLNSKFTNIKDFPELPLPVKKTRRGEATPVVISNRPSIIQYGRWSKPLISSITTVNHPIANCPAATSNSHNKMPQPLVQSGPIIHHPTVNWSTFTSNIHNKIPQPSGPIIHQPTVNWSTATPNMQAIVPFQEADVVMEPVASLRDYGSVRMYDLETIFSRYENVLQRLIYNYWDRSSINNPSWALPFRSPVIFLRPIYYLLNELKDVDKIISPDSDMIFMADIYQLYSEFSKMNETQMIGMGPEFVYCDQVFKIYNSQHPNNEVMKKNHVCLNGGLQISDLEKLRKSKVFNYLITEEGAHKITDKYRMAMYLGDQDMLTLIKTEYPQFFHVLDCRWNYQLNAVYNVPYRLPCEAPAFLYHGNSLQRFPEEEENSPACRLEFGEPSYTERSLSFPLHFIEFYAYTKVNIDHVYSVSTDIRTLQELLKEIVEYNSDNGLNHYVKIVRKPRY